MSARHERRRAQNAQRHLARHPNPPVSVQQEAREKRQAEEVKLAAMTDEERDQYLRRQRQMVQAAPAALAGYAWCGR